MGLIDRAILQDEIRQALNALFKTGQVGRVESAHVILDTELTGNIDFDGTIARIEPADPNLLEVGKTYTVTTDSGTYKTVCKSPNADFKYIGNIAKLDGGANGVEDTGEPFAGALIYENLGGNGGWFFIFVDLHRGSHLKIVGEETIRPIDRKFIPGAVLPVVELSEETCAALFGGSEATLTESEAAVFESATKAFAPVLVRANFDGMVMAIVALLTTVDGRVGFLADTGTDMTLAFAKPGGVWVVAPK